MAYTRKIRIEYYQVVKQRKSENDNGELYELEKLLVKAENMTLEERTYEYYQEEARLDKMKHSSHSDCYYLNFVRLRQTKIPVRAKKNSEATPIELTTDEYIGEDVSAVYDKKNMILALQRNRDSLSSTGIAYYLSNLLGSEKYEIELIPVSIKDIEQRLKKAKGHRKIVLKFATDKLQKKVIPRESSFNKLLNFTKPFEGNNVTITISMGRNKGSMDSEVIANTISDISNTTDFVSGAELFVKYTEDGPTELIDLFSMKYHNFITMKMEKRESIDYIKLCDEIRGVYQKYRTDIIKCLSIKRR